MKLFDYQNRLLVEISKAIKAGERSIIAQLPTGGGKTVIFSELTNLALANKKRVMILTDRKELLSQTDKTLQRFMQLPSLLKAGGRINFEAKVYVAMIETLANRISKDPYFFSKLGKIDYLIIDEAHKANFTKVIESFLQNETVIIGFTATPISSNKVKPLTKYYNKLISSIQVSDLIEIGRLAIPTYYSPPVDLSKLLKKSDGEFSDESMLDIFGTEASKASVIELYRKYALGTKAICFDINVQDSIEMTNLFNANGIKAKHVNGNTPDKERERIFTEFKAGGFRILCNVGIATTGFDEPSIETVILRRATASLTLYLQMVGRGGRVTESKKQFTILDIGNSSYIHNFWHINRDWQIIFRENKDKQKNTGVAPVKECKKCGRLLPISSRKCNCGYEYEIKAEPKSESELKQLERTQYVSQQQISEKRLSELSISELIEVQKLFGIKATYIHRVIRSRGAEAIKEYQIRMKYKSGWYYHQLQQIGESSFIDKSIKEIAKRAV
jgi:superfamily II DNA or RNA helicase